MKVYRSTGVTALSRSLVLVLVLVLAVAPPLFAEENDQDEKEAPVMDEVVVTATRTEIPLEESTKSIEVITKEDLDEQQQTYIPGLIDNLPGVLLRRTGGIGQWSNVTIRGAGPQYTQYQYNGLALKDIGDPQGSLAYHIEDLFAASNLDRIEVLKGTNSTLYGSDVMGGVVNIIPQKWQGGLKAELRTEIGPHNTLIGNARAAYGQENYYIDFNPIYTTTDGMPNDGDGEYYYDNLGFTFGGGFKPFDDASLEANAIFYDTELGYGNGPSIDANGNLIAQQAIDGQHREGQLYQVGLIWSHQIMPLWDYTVKGSFSETQRHYFFYDREGEHSDYDGKDYYVEMQHNWHITKWLTFTLGGDFEKQNYIGKEPFNPAADDYTTVEYDEKRNIWNGFGQAQFALFERSLFFNMGGRYNDAEGFDDETVWEVSAAYILKPTQTKFHAHVGTGYRAPSLYELYGGYVYNGFAMTVGNPDLVPEESLGWEMGIDQTFLGGKLKTGATYFKTEFENLIQYSAGSFNNVEEAETSGIESYISYRPWQMLRLDVAYTYYHLEGRTNYPRHKFDLLVTAYPMENLTLLCDISYQDDKTVSVSGIEFNEDHPAIINMALTTALSDHMDFFVRIENLLDREYTEGGWLMPGLTPYLGVKLSY